MCNIVELHTRSRQMCAVCCDCETTVTFRYEVNMKVERLSHHDTDYRKPSISNNISVRCNQCGELMILYRDGLCRLNTAIQNKLGLDKMLIINQSMPKYENINFDKNSVNKEFTYPLSIYIADSNDELWNTIRDEITQSVLNFIFETNYTFISVETDNHTIGSIWITFIPDKFIEYYKNNNIEEDILEFMKRVFMDLLDYIAYDLE